MDDKSKEIKPEDVLRQKLEYMQIMLQHRVEEEKTSPKPTPPSITSGPPLMQSNKEQTSLENLLEQTNTLLETINSDGQAFSTAAKTFATITSHLASEELKHTARELLDPIDQHAETLGHPTHILRNERKAQSTETQLTTLKDQMTTMLNALEGKATEIRGALVDLYDIDTKPDNPTMLDNFRSLLFEYRTRIPEADRKAAWLAARAFEDNVSQIKNDIDALTNPADARQLLKDLNQACVQFQKDCKKHKRSIDRVDFGERLYAPLIGITNFLLDENDSTTHIKSSAKTAVEDITTLTKRFIEWETTPSDYQKEERATLNKLLYKNLSHITTKSPTDAGWPRLLTSAATGLNNTLRERRSALYTVPLSNRLAHFDLINTVQKDLDEIIAAQARDDDADADETCYIYASALMETLRDAKTRIQTPEGQKLIEAIEDQAYTVLYAIETASENSAYPTRTRQEETLRENVATTLENTQVIIDRLRDMGHPENYLLITEAQTFMQACEDWQLNRPNSYPADKADNNQYLIEVYDKFDAVLQQEQAKKVIRQNKPLEQAYNALVGGINFFIRHLYSPQSQLQTYSRDDTMEDIKARMQAIKATQTPAPTPRDDSPPKDKNKFEQQLDACQTYVRTQQAVLNKTIQDAETNLKLGASIATQAKIIEKATVQLNSIRYLEGALKLAQGADPTDPDDFLTAGSIFATKVLLLKDALAPCTGEYKNEKPVRDMASLKQAEALINAIEEHAQTLGKPVHIKASFVFNKQLAAIHHQIDTRIIQLEGLGNSWLNTEINQTIFTHQIYDLGTLKAAVETFEAYHTKHKEAGNAWVPSADDAAFKTLTKAFEAYAQSSNSDSPTIQKFGTLKSLVEKLTPSKQEGMKASVDAMKDENKLPPEPSTPAPDTHPKFD